MRLFLRARGHRVCKSTPKNSAVNSFAGLLLQIFIYPGGTEDMSGISSSWQLLVLRLLTCHLRLAFFADCWQFSVHFGQSARNRPKPSEFHDKIPDKKTKWSESESCDTRQILIWGFPAAILVALRFLSRRNSHLSDLLSPPSHKRPVCTMICCWRRGSSFLPSFLPRPRCPTDNFPPPKQLQQQHAMPNWRNRIRSCAIFKRLLLFRTHFQESGCV